MGPYTHHLDSQSFHSSHHLHWWWSFWHKSTLDINFTNGGYIVTCLHTHHNGIILFLQLWASLKHVHLDEGWHGTKTSASNISHHRIKEVQIGWLENTRKQKNGCQSIQRQILLPKFTRSFSLEPSISFYIPNIATQASVSVPQPLKKKRRKEKRKKN